MHESRPHLARDWTPHPRSSEWHLDAAIHLDRAAANILPASGNMNLIVAGAVEDTIHDGNILWGEIKGSMERDEAWTRHIGRPLVVRVLDRVVSDLGRDKPAIALPSVAETVRILREAGNYAAALKNELRIGHVDSELLTRVSVASRILSGRYGSVLREAVAIEPLKLRLITAAIKALAESNDTTQSGMLLHENIAYKSDPITHEYTPDLRTLTSRVIEIDSNNPRVSLRVDAESLYMKPTYRLFGKGPERAKGISMSTRYRLSRRKSDTWDISMRAMHHATLKEFLDLEHLFVTDAAHGLYVSETSRTSMPGVNNDRTARTNSREALLRTTEEVLTGMVGLSAQSQRQVNAEVDKLAILQEGLHSVRENRRASDHNALEVQAENERRLGRRRIL